MSAERREAAAKAYLHAARKVETMLTAIADRNATTDGLAAAIALQREATDELLSAYLEP